MPFNPAKAKLLFQLTFQGSWPTTLAFTGSGRKLAAANQLGQLFLWELPEKPPEFKPDPKKDAKAPNLWPVRQLQGHTNEITHLAATPDGQQLISTSLDRTIRVWPTKGPADGKSEVILDGDARKRESRRSGKKEAVAPGISVERQTASKVLKGHKEWIYALGLSRDGNRMITGDAASHVIVWDLASKKEIARWSCLPWNWIIAASLSPDGKTALISENRYKRDDFDIPAPGLKLFEVETGKEKLDFLKIHIPKFDEKARGYGESQIWRKFVANGLIATDFSPDGKLVAVAQGGETDKGKIHLLDSSTGKLVRTVSGHQSGATDVLFTKDGKHVISVGRDTCVRICQVADGKEIAVLNSPRGGQFKDWLSAVALSPDEQTLAATDIAGLIHVWDVAG